MRLFAFLPAALAVYQSICESPAFLLPAIPLSPNISRPHHRMRRSIVVHRELTALFPVALLFYSPPTESTRYIYIHCIRIRTRATFVLDRIFSARQGQRTGDLPFTIFIIIGNTTRELCERGSSIPWPHLFRLRNDASAVT